MAIEAPLSRYKRNTILIYIVGSLALAAWFAYDGYLNESFIAEHTSEDGEPEFTLLFNQYAPPVLLLVVVGMGGYLFAIRGRKVVAEDDALVIAGKERIPYDAIEKIDRTHFEKKGFFTITYTNGDGKSVNRKLDDRQFDNLGPILDHLIAKIT